MEYTQSIKAIRASILDIARVVDKPEDIEQNIRFIEDGLMLVDNGRIEWVGEWSEGKDKIPSTVRIRSYPARLSCQVLSTPIFTILKPKWLALMANSYWNG